MGRDGIVEDWDMAEKVWEYSFTSRLTGPRPGNPFQNGLNDIADGELPTEMEGVEAEEKPLADSPLLMSECGWNPTKAREKTIEIAMEKWGTPAFYLARNGVLAAYVPPFPFILSRPAYCCSHFSPPSASQPGKLLPLLLMSVLPISP